MPADSAIYVLHVNRLLLLRPFLAKQNGGRPVCECIHIQPNGLGEATDGHRLLHVPEVVTAQPSQTLDGFPGALLQILAGQWTAIRAFRSKVSDEVPFSFVMPGTVRVGFPENAIHLPDTMKERGSFANTSRIWPKEPESLAAIGLNPALLSAFPSSSVLTFYGPRRAVVVTPIEASETWRGLIMPVSIPGEGGKK